MRTVVRHPSGQTSFPKIKQGFIVDSGGEIILDSRLLGSSLKRDPVFAIKVQPRCACGLHNLYQAWVHRCEAEARAEERRRQEEKEEQARALQEQARAQREAERAAQRKLLQRDEITLTIEEPDLPTFKDTFVQAREVACKQREDVFVQDANDLEAMEWLGRQSHEAIFELLALPKALLEPVQCGAQRSFPYYF